MKSKTDDRLRTRRAPTAGDKRLLNALLVILVLLQPFLDNYYLYTDKVAAYTHGITVPPLLVLLTVAVLSAYYFFKYRGGQTGRLLFWYFVICAAYFVLHHISCSSFVSYVPGNFNYSLSHEAYYVARLLTPMRYMYDYTETESRYNSVYNGLAIFGGSLVVYTAIFVCLQAFTSIQCLWLIYLYGLFTMPRDFGIPVCSIEKEYINGASGQLRTRFQAFIESVEIKKIQEGK